MVGAGLLHIGGAERDRTVDLLHAMQALSQLSYSPTRAWPAIITPAFEEASNEGPMAGAVIVSRPGAASIGRLPIPPRRRAAL